MGLVFQVLIIVALLFFESHQFGTRDGPPSALGQNPISRAGTRVNNGFSTGMGPYDIDIQLVHRCADQGTNLFKDVLEVYNTKTDEGSKIVYRGNFTMTLTPEQFNTLEVKILFFRIKDKKEFQMVKYDSNFCLSAMGPAKETFMGVKKKLGLEGEDCFFPQGFYSFSNWDIKVTAPQPVMEYGHYKTIIDIIYDHKMASCYEVISEVKQKN